MRDKIKKFINNNSEKTLDVEMLGIAEYEKILKEEKYERHENNGDETNGWQVDFWYNFSHIDDSTIQLCLSGSLFYGNFKLTKDEG